MFHPYNHTRTLHVGHHRGVGCCGKEIKTRMTRLESPLNNKATLFTAAHDTLTNFTAVETPNDERSNCGSHAPRLIMDQIAISQRDLYQRHHAMQADSRHGT